MRGAGIQSLFSSDVVIKLSDSESSRCNFAGRVFRRFSRHCQFVTLPFPLCAFDTLHRFFYLRFVINDRNRSVCALRQSAIIPCNRSAGVEPGGDAYSPSVSRPR